MARSALLVATAALLALLAIACDDASPTDVDDEAYLAVLCAGLDRLSDAIQVETEEAGIAAAIEAFIEDLEAVAPPQDLRDFHAAFIEYLEDALDDPTSPLVVPPPLPEDDVRERLAAREGSVEECREPTFFSDSAADQ